jgi:FKBP-type peptidyl-prolyl cis-trans isomerase
MRRASALLFPGGTTPSNPRCTPDGPASQGMTSPSRASASGIRRTCALAAVALLAAGLAACGSSSSSTPKASSTVGSEATSKAVKVTGAFGASPNVKFPKGLAGPALYTTTLIQGAGKPLTTTESLVGNYVVYDWKGSTPKLVATTFKPGSSPAFFSGQLLPGLQAAIIGRKTGSRVLAVIPPKDGFGTKGNSQIGVGPTDTLVFVIDMVQAIGNTDGAVGSQVSSGGAGLPTVTETPGKAATVKVPSSKPPAKLAVKTLVKGTGQKAVKGDLLIVQYTGVVWKAGTPKPFDSSWSRSAPFSLTLGQSQVVKGWEDGLAGQTGGSRVMLAVPPAEGYGANPPSGSGIGKTDTMVFVIDILGVYGPTK